MDQSTQFWLEVWRLIVTAAVTVTVGVITAWIANNQRKIAASQRDIAHEQRRVATAKLNLDLFDRRCELFMQVWGFLSHGAVGDVKEYSDPDLTNLIPKARFLFGDEIAGFMNEAASKKTQMALGNKQKAGGHWPTPEKDAELLEIGKWFQFEATNCFKRFDPYLDFSSWRAETGRKS